MKTTRNDSNATAPRLVRHYADGFEVIEQLGPKSQRRLAGFHYREDAELFAAARELLAALEDIRHMAASRDAEDWQGVCTDIESFARAAIAKARGVAS